MTPTETADILRQFNEWRRGAETIEQRHDRCIHPSGPHPMNEFCQWRTPKTEGAI